MPKFLDVTNLVAARAALGVQGVSSVTAVKTAGYTAAAGEMVPCDASAGGFTVALPLAPPNNSRIIVKKLDSSANAVLVQRTGTDTFNQATVGPSTLQLLLPSQAVVLRYHSGVWHVESNGAAPAALDDRYTARNTRDVRDLNGSTALAVTATGGPNYLRVDPSSSQPLLAGNAPMRDAATDIILANDGPKLRAANEAGTDVLNLYLSGQNGGGVYVAQPGAGNTSEVATTTGRQNLRGKRLTPREVWAASASSVTPDLHVGDFYNFSALAENLTVNAPEAYVVGGVGPNWLPDPSFEGAYRPRPQGSLSTELARTGSRSIKMTAADPGVALLSEDGTNWIYLPCSGGETFYGSVFVRGAASNVGNSGSVQLGAQIRRGNPLSPTTDFVSFQTINASTSLSAGWTKLEGYIKVPQDGFEFMAYASVSSLATGESYYFDDAVLRSAGNPKTGEELLFCFEDNGTSRTITWNAAYRAAGFALPTATVPGQWTYVRCVYNSIDDKWDVVDVRVADQRFEITANKGVANGYASLDAGGKLPVSQLPTSAFEYKGAWNASANTPTLANGTGDAGDTYRVSVGGTNLGATYSAGDLVIYDGATWQRVDSTDAVDSVNGYTGAVVLSKSDLGLGNVDNTSDATKNAAAVTLTNKTISGTSNTLSNISISSLSDATRLFNNMGNNATTTTSFDAQGSNPNLGFGFRFVFGATNGPGTNSATTYYTMVLGLGNDYTSSQFQMQMAIPRNVTTPYISIRYQESAGIGAWQKIAAGYADSAGALSPAALTQSSGVGTSITINPTINQSSTAGYTALLINPTETATGSGVKNLLDAQVGGTSRFRVDNTGLTTAQNYLSAVTSTATAAGTTTLTITSARTQVFTGTTTQTVRLPTTSVTPGTEYRIINNSSGAVTVQSSGANTVSTVAANTLQLFIALVDTPTTAAHWRAI